MAENPVYKTNDTGPVAFTAIGAGNQFGLTIKQGSRHNRAFISISCNQTFSLLLKMSSDGGTTWYTVRQLDSSVVVADAATPTYVNGAVLTIDTPSLWKLDAKNTSVSAMAGVFDIMIYDDKSLVG